MADCFRCMICLSINLSLLNVAMGDEPVRLIFDTDIGNDVDDALALGVIHSLQSRDKCELLAVTITKDHPASPAFVDAINSFYGRGGIPIGIVEDGPTPEPSKFTVLATKKDSGKLRYPHDLTVDQKAPGATDVLRKTLAAQPDGSVVIAQVGFSTNLARLLESPGDEHSPMNGRDLVEKKVRLLSAMAGAFQSIGGNDRYLEYNVKIDVPSAQKLAAEWPTPIVFSGFEIGIAIPYPSESILRDYAYVEHHPLAEAYHLYSPPPHNRPTWDLTSVLYAVEPDRGYFDLSPAGTVSVADDGFTSFEAAASGRHRYLIVNDHQVTRVTEALVNLSSEPPH